MYAVESNVVPEPQRSTSATIPLPVAVAGIVYGLLLKSKDCQIQVPPSLVIVQLFVPLSNGSQKTVSVTWFGSVTVI